MFLDKDKYTAAMLEAAGLRLFNRRSAVEICDDKMLTHLALAGKGIPMPDTVAGALCYTQDAALSDETVRKLENSLGYPMIIKQSYGSLGKGIYRVENRKELKNVYDGIKLAPHLFQRSIEESYGRDVRVIVVGRKCVAAMERRSDGDFRSNLELGGKGCPYKTDIKLNDICRRTAEILNLDYCGIDLLVGREGYLVCEVNSNAFFGGIEKVTGIDVAKIYAEYIYGEIY